MEFSSRSISLSISEKIRRIRGRLPDVMLQDRQRFSKTLQTLARKAQRGEEEKTLLPQLDALDKRLEAAIHRLERRRADVPKVSYPEHLPIFAEKEGIIQAIQEHQVVIISGATGSGKSTQIPKMCLEAGRGILGGLDARSPEESPPPPSDSGSPRNWAKK